MTEEWEVRGLIPRVLKSLRNEGTAFALQMAGPSPGSNDHITWQSHLPVGDVKIVSPINIITVVLNTVTLKIKCI